MNKEMVKALLWKEWRETRLKWLAFYAAFHTPAIIGVLAFTFNSSVRFDVRVMNNVFVMEFLQLFLLVQSGFVTTAGLFLIAFFAAGAVAPEIDNRSMFFLFERPLYRWQILTYKFLVGAFQAMVCVGFSIVTTLTLGYLALNTVAVGVTIDGSWPDFIAVIKSGLRGTLWTGMLGMTVFSGTFLFSVIFEKWWVGVIAGAISLIGMFYFLGKSIFDWVFSTLTQQKPGKWDLSLYAQLDLMPLLIMLLVTGALFFASQMMFARKELR